MRMKTFQALTMPEALRAIKEELGPDAVILSTKQVRTGDGMFGLFGRTMIEVVAADDARPAPVGASTAPLRAAELPREKATPAFQTALYSSLAETAPAGAPRPTNPGPGAATGTVEWGRITAELRELRHMVERSVRDRRSEHRPAPPALAGLPPPLIKVYYDLINNDVEAESAEALVRRVYESTGRDPLQTDAAARGEVRRLLAAGVRASGPLLGAGEAKKTVVFVGPTGVGKTTTIAKIAARYKLKEKRNVALITLDTYRVAAVEQLRLYANIIGVSLEVALTKREALDFIRRRSKSELILLDTAGRSPMDSAGVDELQELLALDHPLETHLVMSATTRERDLMDAMSRYAALPIDHLVFTKLDETTAFGHIYTMMQRTGLPLSYFSIGQSVPEDLEVVSPDRLADLVLGAPLRGAFLGSRTAAASRPDAVRRAAPTPPARAVDLARGTRRPSDTERPAAPERPPGPSVRRPVPAPRRPGTPVPRGGFATRLSAWLGFGQGGKQ